MNRLLILILVSISLLSCTKVIDYDLNDSQSRIVVDGLITDEAKAHEVKLTRSGSYYENSQPVGVSGAVVSINDGTNTYFLTELPAGSGCYFTDPTVKGVPGKTYTLRIEYENEIYSAISKLDPVSQVDSVMVVQLFETMPISGNIDSSYSVLLFAQEIAGQGNYYEWNYYINNKLETDTLRKRVFTDDATVDGNYIFAFPIYEIDHEDLNPGDSVTLEMRSISKLQYEFMLGLMLETDWRGSPFDGPPANVPTNMTNGALGFFSASAVSKKTAIIY